MFSAFWGAQKLQLIFIYGPPATGKLTVAVELGRITGFPVFHNHLVVDMLLPVFAFGSPSFVELREAIWMQVLERAALEQTDGLIFTFTPETTVHPQFVNKLVAIVEGAGSEVIPVQLICPEDEVEKRLVNKSRARFEKLTSLGLYRQLRDEGSFVVEELFDVRLTIDTSTLHPDQAAGHIVEHYRLPSGG